MYRPCVLSAPSISDIENGRWRANSGRALNQASKRELRSVGWGLAAVAAAAASTACLFKYWMYALIGRSLVVRHIHTFGSI